MKLGFPDFRRAPVGLTIATGFLVIATGLFAISFNPTAAQPLRSASCTGPVEPVWIDGGTFELGSAAGYPEERGLKTVLIEGFWIAPTEVTVSQFAAFVQATDYVTTAERDVDPTILDQPNITTEAAAALLQPGGAVFQSKPNSRDGQGWWRYVPGANWRYPEGLDGRVASDDEPVTQVTIADALAFANWAGGRLPSEAEWEYAALAGGGDPALNAPAPKNANTWQGIFPVHDLGHDGFAGVAPVGCFAPNAFGLYDMLGNVWEITSDDETPVSSGRVQTTISGPPGSTTIKGGSFLCAENFCRRYRPAARQAQEADLATNHIGFRLIYELPPQAKTLN